MSAMTLPIPASDRSPRRTAAPPPSVASPIGPLQIVAVDATPSPLRWRMEAFVRDGYRTRFDARVASLLPQLLGATDRSGTLRAVIGFGAGTRSPLFLEQYLDAPIEDAVTRVAGRSVRREQILEVGNLVTDPTRVAPAFLQAFVLWTTSFTSAEWLAFTGTRPLRVLLARLGADLRELAVARPERLIQGAEDWGAYYAHQPRVMAVSLASLLPCVDAALFDRGDPSR